MQILREAGMNEQRNEYGFPVVAAKVERAKQYAAEAKARNSPPCDCEACRQTALLPAVQRITERWRS